MTADTAAMVTRNIMSRRGSIPSKLDQQFMNSNSNNYKKVANNVFETEDSYCFSPANVKRI